ncbi:hypothetical protein BO78DRAFT_395361 [Aspergillus sclerotiicarbonarius CBS 121057]|uniref:DUF202 domain-containing protein n=1 Tax=Aspergillus sclerotiicarbonarius (strain CBS 121057 / IBT 28362) TaxID=1448318 RepID=A0A319EM85_ASPSB|nr:hypothetical protein BO78DRAFT_395361 [Aspergillus sclerotiicarbonarius CBS 121057]
MVDRRDHQPAPDHEPATATGREGPTPPAAIHAAQPRPDDDNDSASELDALELREIATQDDDEAGFSTESISSGEYRIRPQRTVSRTVHTNREASKGLWGRIRRFWTRNVVLTVPQKSNRDHFALERTFLAYIRTSVMVAMQGVVIAQLFRLQHLASPDNALGFYEVGIPLAVSCYGVAILIAFMGAYRFWKQQNVVALGTVYAGGWELNCIGGMIGLIVLTTFVLSLTITIELDNE